jgi:excisionase family DNA binding protein
MSAHQSNIEPLLTKRVALMSAHQSNVEPLPTKRDIAKRYGVSRRTVDTWVASKLIPYLDLGHRTKRFIWADVERALERLKVKEVQ